MTQIWETLLPHFSIARAFSEKNCTKLLIHLASSAEKLTDAVFTPVTASGVRHAEGAVKTSR